MSGSPQQFFLNLNAGHRPVVLQKEIAGFVGNRLAYALLREASYLVNEGVVSAKDLDIVVEASLGPRWAIQGPFKSYNMGGGVGGLPAFLDNLSGTIQHVWDSTVAVNFRNPTEPSALPEWAHRVVQQTESAYGFPGPADFSERDKALREVLRIQSNST